MADDRIVPDNLAHGLHYPNESKDYRTARNALLRAEMELRRQTESVAAQRRALPLGGKVQDYVFESEDGPVKLSELFKDGKDSLFTYAWMFGPERRESCASCAAFLDGLEGAVPPVSQHINFAVIARSPIERMVAFKKARGWRNLPMLSSGGTSFNADYFALLPNGYENPMTNVFERKNGQVYHFWGSELFYAQPEEGQHPRHNGTLDVLWNILDLTPHGRGTEWTPELRYGSSRR